MSDIITDNSFRVKCKQIGFIFFTTPCLHSKILMTEAGSQVLGGNLTHHTGKHSGRCVQRQFHRAEPQQLQSSWGRHSQGGNSRLQSTHQRRKFPRHLMEASEGHCSSAEPNLNSGHQWEQSTMISDTLKPSLQPELPSN